MSTEENKVVQENEKDSLFTFVHEDGKVQIHDQKFETKASTFAKDAFKRFCKNKSSVVAAIIIGILVVGSFIVPLVSPYQTTVDQSWQSFLEPKLFDNANGFWDGTKLYENAVYDNENKTPVASIREQGKINPEAIVDVFSIKEKTVDEWSAYGEGGRCLVLASKTLKENEDPYSKPIYSRNRSTDSKYPSYPFTFESGDEISLKVKYDTREDYRGYVRASKCRVIAATDKEFTSPVVIEDWFDYKSELDIDLAAKLVAGGITSAPEVYISLEGLPVYKTNASGVPQKSYVLYESIEFTGSNASQQDVFKKLSCDGNDMAVINLDDVVWNSNGTRSPCEIKVWTCNFRYDIYEHVFGKREVVVGKTRFNEYIEKGWCTFDFDTMEFHVLDEKHCPVIEVYSAIDASQFKCLVTYYKYMGLSSVPKYIFGSTPQGHDLFTKAIGCLKNSLLVAIIASAICLVVGLIWGSISGYFGGTVDLVMERITDIISGVPWTIMMTLIMLLLGRNIVTFGLALVMTGWIGTASTTRTQFYRFRDREYVLASRTLGARDTRLIFRHILPNALGTIVTSSVLMIPSCIFSEATMSYLGLGLKGTDSFGVLFSEYQKYLNTEPILIIIPIIIISLLMISFNLFGNGLRDALNPTLKGGEQ